PPDDSGELIRSAYNAAVKVFFLSHGNQRLVERMLGYRIPNAAVVWNPCGVDPGVSCPYPSTETTFRSACVGRLEPSAKGQDLLIEVLKLEKWAHRNLEVSFFGTGACATGLQALTASANLKNVTFCGWVDNVVNVWKDHHLL